MKLIPVAEYEWTDDYSFQRNMTCINHQTARYSTKNPFFRSIHIHKLPEGNIFRTVNGECICPFADLAVIVEDEGDEPNP
jgi:hypothetical protein